MSLMLASVEDVEAVAKAVPAADVTRVTRLIEMVSGRVASYTGQDFVQVAGDSITIQPHDGLLRLPQRPVTALTSITVGTTLVASTFYSWESNGVLLRSSPFSWAPDSQFDLAGWGNASRWPIDGQFPWPPIPTTVVYSHGYAPGTYPDDVAGVVAEKVAVKWLSGQRNADGTQSEAIDGYHQTFQRLAHVSAGSAWDPEHKEILDEYRRSKFASLRLG